MSAAVPDELLLVHGEQSYLVDRESASWLAAARAACVSDLNVEILDSPTKLDPLRRSVSEVPFLDDRRYVLVRDPPQLGERTRRGAEGADALAAVIEQRSPTTSLCLVTHGRVAPTNPVLVVMQRLGARIAAYAAPRGRELREWIGRRVRERGLQLDRAATERLVAGVGGDLGRLETELDKLVAFADGRTALTGADVAHVVSGDEPVEVWSVMERLLTPPHGAGPGAIDALLDDGVPVTRLISVLAGQLRELLLAADMLRARRGGATLIAAELGIPSWRAERLGRWARDVDPDVVEAWLRRLQQLDALSKLGEASDVEGLRAFGLRAAGDLERR